MAYEKALAWLYSTQLTGIKLGLDTMARLLDAFEYDGGDMRIVHVAGTNGKGSVCAMLDAVCRAGGYRTGLFTSPHLMSFRERIRIDGAPIPEPDVVLWLDRMKTLTADWQTRPTFFEYTTAMALCWFQQQRVEIVALETGLGGRLDSTNVVTPAVSVLTSIDFDHTAWLGGTLAAIAGEKAGIIKPGVPVVSAPQAPEAAEVIARCAREKGAPLRIVADPVPDGWPVGLAGTHQRMNASLSLAALDASGIATPEAARRQGLSEVNWPGRFQRLENGRIILDGGHNPAAAERLARTWLEEYGAHQRASIVIGMLRDKDIVAVCRALGPIAARFYPVPVNSPRAASPEELSDALRVAAPAVPSAIVPRTLAQALEAARAHYEPILVTGSLFLVGEALARLTGQPAPEASWQ